MSAWPPRLPSSRFFPLAKKARVEGVDVAAIILMDIDSVWHLTSLTKKVEELKLTTGVELLQRDLTVVARVYGRSVCTCTITRLDDDAIYAALVCSNAGDDVNKPLVMQLTVVASALLLFESQRVKPQLPPALRLNVHDAHIAWLTYKNVTLQNKHALPPNYHEFKQHFMTHTTIQLELSLSEFNKTALRRWLTRLVDPPPC